jgi:hypothetical protein
MTIKSRRSRPGGEAGSRNCRNQTATGSIGSGLIALALTVGVAGCPGQLDESTLTADASRPAPTASPPPPPPVAPPPVAGAGGASGAGGRGGRGGMGGSSPPRVDAAVNAPPPVAANCWDPPEVAKILAKCTGCHNSTMPTGMLDLQSPMVKNRLLNQPSRGCRGAGTSTPTARPLVYTQGNAVGGHFFDKLRGTQPMECGQRMPRSPIMGQAGMPLSEQEIWCLQYWFIPPQGSATPPPPPPPTAYCTNPADEAPNILKAKCGTCHNPAVPNYPGQLDLFNAGIRGRLEGIPAKTCANKTLIVRGRPEGHFFDKLQNAIPNCGTRMPPTTAPLSAAEVKCLKDWIAPGVAQ